MEGSLFVMVAVIVVITSVTSVMKEFVRKGSRGSQHELLTELRALRDEVRQLRQQNNDVILSLDSAIHRVDQRLARVEHETPAGAVYAGRRQV